MAYGCIGIRWSELLLRIVRFVKDGSFVSIMVLLPVILACVTMNTFPVLSYAVMLNSKGPFVESSITVMYSS